MEDQGEEAVLLAAVTPEDKVNGSQASWRIGASLTAVASVCCLLWWVTDRGTGASVDTMKKDLSQHVVQQVEDSPLGALAPDWDGGWGNGWMHGTGGFWRYSADTWHWDTCQKGDFSSTSEPPPLFDPKDAKAFAAFSKLAFCGQQSGLLASVSRCGLADLQYPHAMTACKESGLTTDPTTFHTFSKKLLGVEDALFGYTVSLTSVKDWRQPSTGCLVVLRGAVDNYANDVVFRDTTLAEPIIAGIAGCEQCNVHRGFLEAYRQVRGSLLESLRKSGCTNSKLAKVWFTGHGFAAAILSIAMYDLKDQFLFQPSYLFESPKVGDAMFAARFSWAFSASRPIFFISEGSEQVSQWPRGSVTHDYERNSFEVHIPCGEGGKGVYQVCLPNSCKKCGVSQYTVNEIKEDHFCTNSIAPDGSFCVFPDYQATCALGEAFTPESGLLVKERREVGLTFTSLINANTGVAAVYSEPAAKAFIAISKQLICGPTPAIPHLYADLCGPVCKDAGFQIQPGMIRLLRLADEGAEDSIFGVVFRIKHEAGASSTFPPQACVVSLRLTPEEIELRRKDTELVDIGKTHCPGCKVHKGFKWIADTLIGPVENALTQLNCPSSYSVYVTGYSFSAGVVPILMWYLHLDQWDVQTSYTFGQPKMSNKAFNDALATYNKVPLFRVTYKNDVVPAFPNDKPDYADIGYEVHYTDNADGSYSYVVCGGTEECGISRADKSDLSSQCHCSYPVAPEKDMCPTSAAFYDKCFMKERLLEGLMPVLP